MLLKPTRELCSSEVWSCLIHRWWTKPRICCRSCQCVRAFPPAGKLLLGWMGVMGLNFAYAFQVCWNKNETKLKRSGQCNPCVCVLSNLSMTRGRWDCFLCPGDSGPVLRSYSHRAGHRVHGEDSAAAIRDEWTGQRLWSSRSRGQGSEQLPNMLILSFQVSSTVNRA